MRQIEIGKSSVTVSAVAQGCMHFNDLNVSAVDRLVHQDLENGINFFDHADCYSNGLCEELFGKVLKQTPSLRDQMNIQTKVGIFTGELYYFDFSKKHIVEAVEQSLTRLNTEHIDFLLLHRPDTLVEPDEVAAAFDKLAAEGKVSHFGVSNQNPYQVELLKKSVKQPLEINQLQFSIMHTGMIDTGFCANTKFEGSVFHDGGILEYSRINDMTIQAWSPFQYGFFEGPFLDNPAFPDLNNKISEIAQKYNVSNTAIAIAWILRHPANMQAVIGTTNPKRIHDSAKGSDINLTRHEWYEIYHAAGNFIP